MYVGSITQLTNEPSTKKSDKVLSTVETMVISWWHKFNINDNVKVKLTAKGMDILVEKYGGKIPQWFHDNYKDENGYYQFQMHDLMKTFGSEMWMGNKLPFEPNIYIDFGGSL